MEYRRMGKSGLKLSALSFGSWVTFAGQIDRRKAVDCLRIAYEAGVNFFDNAEGYAAGESERVMGEALKELAWDRSSYMVSSKVFFGGDKPTQRGLSRKHIHDACHAALKRLQVEYLDLFFCHRPDPETPIEETVRAMNTLIDQGKVLYWGTSEWSAEEISTAIEIAQKLRLVPPAMEQPQYNMLHRERLESEYKLLCREYGLGTTVWSPLASGVLTGKYQQGIPAGSRFSLKGYEWLAQKFASSEGQTHLRKVDLLRPLAVELGCSLSQLAIAWCLLEPTVSTVILGASTPEQLQENLAAINYVAALREYQLRIEGLLQSLILAQNG